MVTENLISAFAFATRIVQSLFFVNTKFHASSCLLLWLYSPVCVKPGQKPQRWFSYEAAHILFIKFFICRITEPLDESFHEPEDSANRETMKKHECAICGFGTDRLHNFKRHLKIHADAPDEMPKSQVVCTHCGKQFMTMSGLIKGLRSDIYVIKTKMYRYDGEFSSQTRFLKNR